MYVYMPLINCCDHAERERERGRGGEREGGERGGDDLRSVWVYMFIFMCALHMDSNNLLYFLKRRCQYPEDEPSQSAVAPQARPSPTPKCEYPVVSTAYQTYSPIHISSSEREEIIMVVLFLFFFLTRRKERGQEMTKKVHKDKTDEKESKVKEDSGDTQKYIPSLSLSLSP